jgi:hypothetical protein
MGFVATFGKSAILNMGRAGDCDGGGGAESLDEAALPPSIPLDVTDKELDDFAR